MKKYILLLISICVFQTSCDKDFEELNQNPFSPTVVEIGPIFNGLVESLRLGWNRQLFLHNENLYDITELAVVTAQTFNNAEGGAEDVWSNYYTALKNARDLENRFSTFTGDQERTNITSAQLKILMAYKTFQITDLFGDIPYTEAGRAFDEDPIIRPKYDKHEDIYKSLIDDLLWSTDILTNSGDMTANGESFLSYGSFDTFLGNNRSTWAKFANSMLLRYLVRIYDKEPNYAGDIIKNMIDSGASFLVEGEDIVMSPEIQSWSNLGVNWSFREHNKLRMGTTMWNYMRDDNGSEVIDPRLFIFFEPNNAGDWVPFPQISNDNTPQSGGEPYSNQRDNSYEDKGAENIYASFNYYLIRDEEDIPEIIMTSAEVKFLQSEIFLRGIGVAPDAANASFTYQLGVLESLKFWQNIVINSGIWANQPDILTTGELFSVVTHPKYNIDTAPDNEAKLNLIYAQRWVDAFRQPWEAYSLLRRTNQLPREKGLNTFNRFKYPPSESINNADNYSIQVAEMGGDETGNKLWWME